MQVIGRAREKEPGRERSAPLCRPLSETEKIRTAAGESDARVKLNITPAQVYETIVYARVKVSFKNNVRVHPR